MQIQNESSIKEMKAFQSGEQCKVSKYNLQLEAFQELLRA